MAKYQPQPRYLQTAAQIGHKTFLWGGRTQDFTARGRQMLTSSIETFDSFHEKWEQKGTTGLAPPGLYNGACTTVSESLYHFGGYDGHSEFNALHCLNSVTLAWTQVHSQTAHDQPMCKFGCGMTAYHKEDTTYLVLFAGHGIPHGATQPGARFIQNTRLTDGSGWTNEMHLFNLTNGKWTSPPTSGPRPPPCAYFSFTAINHHMAVMFGGYQPECGRVNDVYIINFHSMVWTKLERPEGATWPVERTSHGATCLNYGDDHPQLLVTGGVDKKWKTISDGWLLDINTGRWRELTLPEGTQPRWGHTVTSYQVDKRSIHVTTFGGSPEWDFKKSYDDDPKLDDTTVMEFGNSCALTFPPLELVESGVGSPTNEWVLVGVIGSHELGTPERVKQLEKMKQRKTDHGDQFQPPVAAGRLMISGFPAQLPAMHPTLPYLHQSTTLPVHTPTLQIHHPAQFPVPPTVPTLQPPYSGGRFQEMFPEQLPSFEPPLLPYYAQSLLPHPTVLPSTQSEFYPLVSAYQIEASTAAAPSLQHSTPIGPLDTLCTSVSATSPHTTYTDTPPQESLLPRRTSQTADKPKLEQLPPMEKKPSHPDIKIKMELSSMKESGGIKTEPKGEVEEDDKPKPMFSVSDFEKGDLIEQLTAKNTLLLETISRLKEHIAEQDVYKAAGAIAGKRKQLEASEESVVLKKQRLSDGIGETDASLKVQIKALEAENEELKRQLSQKKSNTSYNSLLGVEVVGEEEVVVTNEAMSFHWEDYGFKLHVPEYALPEGTPEYHVNIKASLSGQFELPEGYELVSAVYWVATPGKFTKPVTIEAQHCANFSNPSQLCFVRTNCTQKSLPYKFKIVDGGSFACGSKYGVLSAPHFSGNGVAKEVTPGEHSCQYCAQVYFTVKHLQDYWYCHFVITKDLEMCLTVVKRKYKQEYDIAPPITFVGDHVALDIPDDGTHTDNGWEIVPLQKARIKKALVDNFSSEKSWVPECVLLLKWLQKDRSPDPLEYKIKLLGTGEENDFFRIFHHPDSWPSTLAETPHMKHPAAVKDLQVELAIHDLLEVTDYLLNLKQTDIYYLGLTLGLTHPHLKTMERSSTFRENMIAAWLQKEDDVTRRGLPTWETLVKALRNDRVNQNGVADKIVTDKNVNYRVAM